MKLLQSFLLVIISFCCAAQNDSSHIKKYRLALPDEWMGKKQVLDQLLTAAPSFFPQLHEKPFCLKCKTSYTLMFFYDSIVVDSRIARFKGTSTEYRWGRTQETSNYECITTYHLKVTWMLLYKDSAIAAMEIISPSDTLTAINYFSMRNNMVILSGLKKRPVKIDYSIFDDPLEFANKYPQSFDPDVADILSEILGRIKKMNAE